MSIRDGAGLAVGLCGVPLDGALEIGELDDELDEVLDGDLEAGAEVNGSRVWQDPGRSLIHT